jgi:hypothetical protein
MANLRWLSGYRDPRCLVRETSEVIMDFLGRGEGRHTLEETVAAAGDAVAVYPSLFTFYGREPSPRIWMALPCGPGASLGREAGDRDGRGEDRDR